MVEPHSRKKNTPRFVGVFFERSQSLTPLAVRLAGGGVFKIDAAGKPGCSRCSSLETVHAVRSPPSPKTYEATFALLMGYVFLQSFVEHSSKALT
jgi:hypothetical protein